MEFDFRKKLKSQTWEAGKVIPMAVGSYRHRIDVVCAKFGKNLAEFENGRHPYAACVRLIRPDGTAITDGNCIVPVLPNYQFLMVWELRPRLDNDGRLELATSLEFPGGAIDNESVTLGCLRECREETGIASQEATLYRRQRAVSPFNSDVICRNYYCALFLTEGRFMPNVPTDGGLAVVSLSYKEVEEAMWDGTVTHGPSHHAWDFYRQIRSMPAPEVAALIKAGHLLKATLKV